MMRDLDYISLPEDIKEILAESDLVHNKIAELKTRINSSLRYHGLIPDNRIDMIRIRGTGNYERLIPLKTKMRLQMRLQSVR